MTCTDSLAEMTSLIFDCCGLWVVGLKNPTSKIKQSSIHHPTSKIKHPSHPSTIPHILIETGPG